MRRQAAVSVDYKLLFISARHTASSPDSAVSGLSYLSNLLNR